jgi:hypothetical protein
VSVVATQGRYTSDSIALGRLSLWVTDSAYASDRPRAIKPTRTTYPLSGATDLPLARIAPVTIAIPVASRDPALPGVQVMDGHDMVIGGHWGPQVFTMDAGVLFEIDSVDTGGFRGHWMEGGRGGVHGEIPGGFSCASRVGAPSR